MIKGKSASTQSQSPTFKIPASFFKSDMNLSPVPHLFEIRFLYRNTDDAASSSLEPPLQDAVQGQARTSVEPYSVRGGQQRS